MTDFDPGTPPAEALENDHLFAAWTASVAGELLLHHRQIAKLAIAVDREGMTIVPLKLYFNEKGRAKIELAIARGKKLHDKRETDKKRSWDRERARLMRVKG